MIKNFTALEIKLGEKVYKFLCEVDSPLGEVHDALCRMKGFVIQKINEAHAAEQPNDVNVTVEDCSACPKEES